MAVVVKKGGSCGGGDGGGEILLLLLFGSGLSFNLSNLFLMAKSTPGGLGDFFNKFTSCILFSNINFF